MENETTGEGVFRNRNYSSQQGRFTSQDPIRFASGQTNHYQFVGNHPHMGTDPSGLYTAKDGHHIVPQELWDGMTDYVKRVFDGFDNNKNGARIRNNFYIVHDGSTLNGTQTIVVNGVSHKEYNDAVKAELKAFLKSNSKYKSLLDNNGEFIAKNMNVEHAREFLEHVKKSSNLAIRAFNEGVRAEVEIAERIGNKIYDEAIEEVRKEHKRNSKAFKEAEELVMKLARKRASSEVILARGNANARLLKLAEEADGILTKLGRYVGFAGKASARALPFVVAGYVYMRTGDPSAAGAELVPGVGYAIMGGEALGCYYEYCQKEIERSAFETRYSEKWYMGPAGKRQQEYEREKAARGY